jgi:hypothetical protein
MTVQTRQDKIALYGKAHDLLVEALARFPREMWQYRPAPDRWTIHEIVVHITDSEANSYVRCRRLIAEPGLSLMAYDENQWASALHYHDQSVEGALSLFQWLRRQSLLLIRDLPEEAWSHQAFHPEDGTITLDDWLDTYTHHVPDHIEQMKAAYRDWLSGEGV